MDKDQQFQEQIKQTIDRQDLDQATINSLRAARMSVLEQEPRRTVGRWVPATAFSCMLLVIVGILVMRDDISPELPQMTADELAVITSDDELELLEELEFYVWFDQEKNV